MGDIAGLVPDHNNKVSITKKREIMFLLEDGLVFNL